MDSLNSLVDQLVDQLTSVFHAQERYLTSDHDFGDPSEWDRLGSAWEHYSGQLEECLQQTKLEEQQRIKLNELVEEHQRLYGYAEAESAKLMKELNKINQAKNAKAQYEGYADGSVFYDKRK